jgi:hypothetical protein
MRYLLSCVSNCILFAQALLDKVRARLDSDAFKAFKADAVNYSNGTVSAEDFHDHVVQAGLATLVPEMAALLPDKQRKDHLLNVHRNTFLVEGAWPNSRYVT